MFKVSEFTKEVYKPKDVMKLLGVTHRTLYNYDEQGMNAILMKPKIDTKGNEFIVSRIGAKRKVDFLIPTNANIYDIIVEQYTNVDLFIVDEAQFCTKQQIDELKVLSKYVDVFCYGLKTNFKIS